MDRILEALQNQAFHLSEATLNFLAGRYEGLVGLTIPDLTSTALHAGADREIIRLHRAQFLSAEYLQSRISNPTTGTLDHLHDSGRSFPHKMTRGEVEARHNPEAYQEHKKEHARSSSLRAQELLNQALNAGYFFPVEFTNDLRYLILRHTSMRIS